MQKMIPSAARAITAGIAATFEKGWSSAAHQRGPRHGWRRDPSSAGVGCHPENAPDGSKGAAPRSAGDRAADDQNVGKSMGRAFSRSRTPLKSFIFFVWFGGSRIRLTLLARNLSLFVLDGSHLLLGSLSS